MSWYSPQPKQLPKRLPRRQPIKVVPSGIGDEGIVGNWLFYYLKGGDHLHDFSPYDNHGTINGAVWKDGQYGWALYFNQNENDYVDTKTDDFYDMSAPLTVSTWVWIDPAYDIDTGEEWDICGTFDGSNGWLFRLVAGDLDLWFASGHASSGYTPSKETWLYWVVTWDGSDIKYYVNGSLIDTVSTTDSIAASTNTLKIGDRGDMISGKGTYGNLNLTRIYNIVRSQSQIERRFARTKGIFSV